MPGRTNWSRLRSKTIDTPKRDAAVARERALFEMTELPESWRTFEDGTPVPDWVAGIDDVRDDRSTAAVETGNAYIARESPSAGS